jgi:hypothetical protein
MLKKPGVHGNAVFVMAVNAGAVAVAVCDRHDRALMVSEQIALIVRATALMIDRGSRRRPPSGPMDLALKHDARAVIFRDQRIALRAAIQQFIQFLGTIRRTSLNRIAGLVKRTSEAIQSEVFPIASSLERRTTQKLIEIIADPASATSNNKEKCGQNALPRLYIRNA